MCVSYSNRWRRKNQTTSPCQLFTNQEPSTESYGFGVGGWLLKFPAELSKIESQGTYGQFIGYAHDPMAQQSHPGVIYIRRTPTLEVATVEHFKLYTHWYSATEPSTDDISNKCRRPSTITTDGDNNDYDFYPARYRHIFTVKFIHVPWIPFLAWLEPLPKARTGLSKW